MLELDSPRGVRPRQRYGFLVRAAARESSLPESKGARAPLAQRADVRTAVLSEDIRVVMVAPGEQRDLELQHRGAVGTESHVVEGAVLEAVRRVDAESGNRSAEPEQRRVEQVRAEVGQHTAPPVAPGRVAHQTRCAIAVEHADAVQLSEPPGVEQRLHPDEVGLKAVVVGGIAGCTAGFGNSLY